jgi:hypothetical protein
MRAENGWYRVVRYLPHFSGAHRDDIYCLGHLSRIRLRKGLFQRIRSRVQHTIILSRTGEHDDLEPSVRDDEVLDLEGPCVSCPEDDLRHHPHSNDELARNRLVFHVNE